ncbi:hypothetical protein R75461_01162 [Paraburkholderia nemoris]|uniref:hypothetical protein n=1 Tax=Paraburkholderia nemoris TaxID=2793076 RepID=UPI001B27848C|nr:hypothetical protein [Paraburkholderia nemoris]CAE6713308.1 hypothetical protein R75461_01162 [Paraburkholderia nemoris]
MTVAELIEELQKFPPHHPVVIEYPGDCEDFTAPAFELGSIEDAREKAVFAHHQPLVVLSAAGWCK